MIGFKSARNPVTPPPKFTLDKSITSQLEEFFKWLNELDGAFAPVYLTINQPDKAQLAGMPVNFGQATGKPVTRPLSIEVPHAIATPNQRTKIAVTSTRVDITPPRKEAFSALDAYQAARLARGHAEMSLYGVEIDSGTPQEKALMFVALERAGIAIKNKDDLMKDADFRNNLKPSSDALKALTEETNFKNAEQKVIRHERPTIAKAKEILDMPQGDMLRQHDAITQEELDARGEVQIRLLAIRLAYAGGALNDAAVGGDKKDSFLIGLAGQASGKADPLTGKDKADAVVATLDEKLKDLNVDQQYLADARAINAKRLATNASEFKLDNKTITIAADKDLPMVRIDTLGDMIFGGGEVKNAVLQMHLSTSRGGLESLLRLKQGEPDTARAEKDFANNFKNGPHPKDKEPVISLMRISMAINDAERRKDTGFVIDNADLDKLLQTQRDAAQIFRDQATIAQQNNQGTRAQGLREIALNIDVLNRHYHAAFGIPVPAVAPNPAPTAAP